MQVELLVLSRNAWLGRGMWTSDGPEWPSPLIVSRVRVFIADINIDAADEFASELNNKTPNSVFTSKCDVGDWDELASAFTKALNIFDRIDYVFPIAGLTERQVIPKPGEQKDVRKEGFVKPDTTVLDVNMMGMINLIMIAVQAFRSQDPKDALGGMKGKSMCWMACVCSIHPANGHHIVVCVASTCGLYAINNLPFYTASKQSVPFRVESMKPANWAYSAIVGFTRTYGARLPAEKITLNAICPHIVRTGLSKSTVFYEDLEKRNLLTDINRILDGFEEFMGQSTKSGECLEAGPKVSRIVTFMDYIDEETRLGCEAVGQRNARLWEDWD